MAISPVTGATGASASIMADYLKLLVTQLQNQNPLEPMSNSEMTSQLAALSQLEQLESMSSTFAKVLEAEKFSQANAILGKRVVVPAEDGEGFEAGTVARVDILQGQPQLVLEVTREVVVDGNLGWVRQERVVGFDEVLSIGASAAAMAAGTRTGDVDGDGMVGVADLKAVADNYGLAGGTGTGDINGDGMVGIADLMAVADNYGPTAGAPE